MIQIRHIYPGIAILMISLLVSVQAFAGNDPSIKGDLRSHIQYSMKQYIDSQAVEGQVYLFDAVKGDLLKLSLDKLHDGIVKKGSYYVSCADFTDHKGRKIDVDFLVRKNGTQLITTQALIHSIDGRKRKYHLEKL